MTGTLHILIKSDSTSGLAEIMSGYLRFYSENRFNVSISGKTRVIHPLAEQVLSEDGIEYETDKKTKSVFIPDLVIFINSTPNESIECSPIIKEFRFPDPLQSNDYDKILSDFRIVREEIKKECIQMVGELQMV